MGNTLSLPGLSEGRTHVRRYHDPDGSLRGRRPEQTQVETIEDTEGESVNGDNEIEVLEPSVSHILTKELRLM